MSGGRSAVFLDRDGVLVAGRVVDGVPFPAATTDHLGVLPGVVEACRALKAAGFLLVCVTNQPDVARGTVSRSEVDAVNDRLAAALGLDAVMVCPHDDADGCMCRKPRAGMLEDAARRLHIDLVSSVMVGDRWRDVGAGRAAGCSTVLVGDAVEPCHVRPDSVATDLAQATARILANLQHLGTRRASTMPQISQLSVRVFGDGADLDGIVELTRNPLITGFTTNPTLMRAAGVEDYEAFSRQVLEVVSASPISLEVFADDFDEMERQALKISSWGANVYVKIPVTDTHGVPTNSVVRRLADNGVKLNVTAIMTTEQVRSVADVLGGGPDSFISVFAGRIADTGRDPIPLIRESLEMMSPHGNLQLIWASPREVLNILQADAIGCHVITVTHELLRKLGNVGKDLTQFSLETVQMFHRDALAAGYTL